MKAVMIMFDSLNKRMLSPYGCTWVHTPNFRRLAAHAAMFDNFFVGSMPCMPARRELHTGRLNFLHRGWTPCEPYDESMPQLLAQSGVYTHLITDHCHYWEDGGANYWNRFSSFEFVRGQEGDKWGVDVASFDGVNTPRRQDAVNRRLMQEEKDHHHVRCFEKGREFILNNRNNDNWYLQLEYFDPHEPFFVPERFKRWYTDEPTDTDWPEYRPYSEDERDSIRQFRINYAALVSMCDEYLGKILDLFDEYDLWKDTMLIVNTDHGFMLGEKGFVGKNYMPVYDELANIPFFIHDPARPRADGTRVPALAQMPDIPCTLLDFFSVPRGEHMTGKALQPLLDGAGAIHDYILYGYFGMHVNMTDGRYTYMRCARTADNRPLYQYTLMPWHIQKPMMIPEIAQADDTLFRGFEFARHTPLLKIPVDERYDKKRYYRYSSHMQYGSLVFDRQRDPQQLSPIKDAQLEASLAGVMARLMRENEAPAEQFVRLGLEDRD